MNLCGECSACCTALRIDKKEIFWKDGDKVAGETCEKLSNGQCSIYEERPPACVKYECLWLQLSKLTDMNPDFRPDKLDAMVSTHYYEAKNEFTFTIKELKKDRIDLNKLDKDLDQFLDIIFKVATQQKGTGVIIMKLFGQKNGYRLNQNLGG